MPMANSVVQKLRLWSGGNNLEHLAWSWDEFFREKNKFVMIFAMKFHNKITHSPWQNYWKGLQFNSEAVMCARRACGDLSWILKVFSGFNQDFPTWIISLGANHPKDVVLLFSRIFSSFPRIISKFFWFVLLLQHLPIVAIVLFVTNTIFQFFWTSIVYFTQAIFCIDLP